MRIAIVQSADDTEFGSIGRHRVEELVGSKSRPGDLWILPEAFDTGWRITPEIEAGIGAGGCREFFRSLSLKYGISICGSCYEKLPGGIFSNTFRAVSASEGIDLGCGKRHLFGDFERSKVKPGNSVLDFSLGGLSLRAVVCYDLRFPVWCRTRKDSPYDAIICVSQWPMQRSADRSLMLAARAVENVAFAINCNSLGGSKVLMPDGSAALEMEVGEELAFISLSSQMMQDFRKKRKYLQDADYFEIEM